MLSAQEVLSSRPAVAIVCSIVTTTVKLLENHKVCYSIILKNKLCNCYL